MRGNRSTLGEFLEQRQSRPVPGGRVVSAEHGVSRPRRAAMVSTLLAFGMLVLASSKAAPPSVPMSVLKQCAEFREPSKRLACYDQVAERPAAAAPPLKQSLGLYTEEHPAPPRVESLITGKVISIGISSSGRSTVTLDSNQVWELDSADPVLANGDLVTVKRGTLGSFILTTPAGRLHRVHRSR
jgi:hypothetical protein